MAGLGSFLRKKIRISWFCTFFEHSGHSVFQKGLPSIFYHTSSSHPRPQHYFCFYNWNRKIIHTWLAYLILGSECGGISKHGVPNHHLKISRVWSEKNNTSHQYWIGIRYSPICLTYYKGIRIWKKTCKILYEN